MAVKFIENYSTLRWTRKSSSLVEKEILSLAQSSATEISKGNTQKLLEIEKHLSRAHELYSLNLFIEAIEEYRRTQTLIYKLLNPEIPVDSAKDPDFTIKIDHDLFEVLLNKNLELIAQIDPKYLEAKPVIDDISPIDPINPEYMTNIGIREFEGIHLKDRTKISSATKVMANTIKSSSAKKTFRAMGVNAGDKVVNLVWESGKSPSSKDIVNKIYSMRTKLQKLNQTICRFFSVEDFSVMLPHIMSYVIPVALGDCYYGLGDYKEAEKNYLVGANYKYINSAIEAPALWLKLAQNILSWGDMLYKEDMYKEALEIYRLVLEGPGTAAVINPASYLYKTASLKTTGNKVKNMLTGYEKTGDISEVNTQLAIVVLQVRERMIKLVGGLDFNGIPLNMVPVWTFEYLQNVSRYFAQQAIQAEREYINFTETADNKKLSRLQLKQTVDIAKAEVNLANKQKDVAVNETNVYKEGYELAVLRKQNAQSNKTEYSSMSWEKLWLDASNTWYGGPDYKIKGTDKKAYEFMYENTIRIGTIARDYELGAMERQINELKQAEEMARAQFDASQSRVFAAEQLKKVAELREAAAVENLEAFDNQTFTPDVWANMGLFLKNISDSYLNMAITTSRLMQKAYNFEFDTNLNFIKVNYTSSSVNGMLASNALLLDIDSFTYDMVTSVKTKSIPVKQTLSLASRYPYFFETSFRKTGVMEFETRIEDFDMDYPGTYCRRIETVEVIVEGLLPSSGVKGFLTNSGISRYRTQEFDKLKFRIQPKDVLALSEYKTGSDSYIFNTDTSKLKLFEGAGVCGSWKLEIPKYANDLDYNYITDVKIVFYYNSFYNEILAKSVKDNFKQIAAINRRSKIIPLNYSFPDSFYYFQENGVFGFNLDESFFPYSESNFKISSMSLIVKKPDATVPVLNINLGTPSHPQTIKAANDSDGKVSITPNHPWKVFLGGDVLGKYVIEVKKEENPSLVFDDKLTLDNLEFVLVMEYDYTPSI